MNQLDQLHYDAMRLVDQADHLRRLGDAQAAAKRRRQAFLKERRAASLISAKPNHEPWRSVLHRSAAVLAMACGEYREAERLIAVGLAGNPPPDIADELRDLLQDVYFEKPIRQKRREIAKTALTR